MDITLKLPDRVVLEAERLAREEGVRVANFLARAIEEHVKTASQQRAIDGIHALLGWEDPSATPADHPTSGRARDAPSAPGDRDDHA